mmetsp:Transcript_41855/g.132117  ORF Transcript_41855/g.132117 Transcript_41855/m.132117 type:complete len:228 (+) Transcript_41855:385-1068(+)
MPRLMPCASTVGSGTTSGWASLTSWQATTAKCRSLRSTAGGPAPTSRSSASPPSQASRAPASNAVHAAAAPHRTPLPALLRRAAWRNLLSLFGAVGATPPLPSPAPAPSPHPRPASLLPPTPSLFPPHTPRARGLCCSEATPSARADVECGGTGGAGRARCGSAGVQGLGARGGRGGARLAPHADPHATTPMGMFGLGKGCARTSPGARRPAAWICTYALRRSLSDA